MQISFDVTSIPTFVTKTEDELKEIIGTQIARALNNITKIIRRNLVTFTPVVSGKTVHSYRTVTYAGQPYHYYGKVWSILPNEVIDSIDLGSRPHFPPVQALRGWCQQILGDENLAFVVARAISKRGTPAHNITEQALVNIDNLLTVEFTQSTTKILEELSK